VICLCGKRQSAPLQSEFIRICLSGSCVQYRATAALTGQNAQEEGMRTCRVMRRSWWNALHNLCFPVILISITHEVRDNIVTRGKHFPHLPCRKAIKIPASQYYVTAASILSNQQAIRPREFSCLCRKVECLWIFLSWRPKFLWCYGVSKCFGEAYWPVSEDGGNTPLRNVCSYLSVDTAPYSRRFGPSWNNCENLHPSFILL
jgi:hypothetical protein